MHSNQSEKCVFFHCFDIAADSSLLQIDRDGYFDAPVDVRDVPDYDDVIKHPMDLRTLASLLEGDVTGARYAVGGRRNEKEKAKAKRGSPTKPDAKRRRVSLDGDDAHGEAQPQQEEESENDDPFWRDLDLVWYVTPRDIAPCSSLRRFCLFFQAKCDAVQQVGHARLSPCLAHSQCVTANQRSDAAR